MRRTFLFRHLKHTKFSYLCFTYFKFMAGTPSNKKSKKAKTAAKSNPKTAKSGSWLKRVWAQTWFKVLTVFSALIGIALGVVIYAVFLYDNVLSTDKTGYLYIPTGSNYEQVKKILKEEKILKNDWTFELVANLMKYPRLVKAGRYKITPEMGNYLLIRNLRIGRQDPVNISFVSIRTLDKLAEKIDEKLEMSAEDFRQAINDSEVLDSLKMTHETIMSIFIPNTYNIYWNVKPKKFIYQMKESFDKFWTEERRKKAEEINLTPVEVVILASIVQEETLKPDEKPRVAGVYLNRLKTKGWTLDADPTVKFAIGDFSLKRLYHKHLKYDSPYNTYKYAGLPPGPITCPSPNTIDAVLNYEKHDYFFFCARPDFSGYHDFSKDLKSHHKNADSYADKLNELKIK